MAIEHTHRFYVTAREGCDAPETVRAFVLKGLAVGASLGVLAGGWAAFEARVPLPPTPIPQTVARSEFDRETQTPQHLGMTLADQGEMALPRPHDDDGDWRWPITIGPEECVAVVAAAWGQRSLSRVAILSPRGPGGGEPLNEDMVFGVAGQAQWCERERRTLWVEVRTPSLARREPPLGDAMRPRSWPGGVRYAVYRGPWSTLGPHLRP